jgi:hypothetical protein
MDLSPYCADYVDFRWPEGVEVFAAAHPFDDVENENITPPISNPAVALPIVTAPAQLVLNLEFGKSYLYVFHFISHNLFPLLFSCSLSVDPKYVHPSNPSSPAETPAIDFQSDIMPGLHEVPFVSVFSSHVVPFTSGPGQVPGFVARGLISLAFRT